MGSEIFFPRRSVSDNISAARERDLQLKRAHQSKVNAGKYKIQSSLVVGDRVLVRNYQKTRKFDPTFLPDEYVIVEVSEEGHSLTLERLCDGPSLKRHPDDVKKFEGPLVAKIPEEPQSEKQSLQDYLSRLAQGVRSHEELYDSGELSYEMENHKRSQRVLRPRPQPNRYSNECVNVIEDDGYIVW